MNSLGLTQRDAAWEACPFNSDFTYSVSEGHSGIVLTTGKVIAIDGPHAAKGIARKLVQELGKARAAVPPQATRPEALSAQP